MITPNEERGDIAAKIGIKNLVLKREDMHPLGSHKGRSIPIMIDHYRELGKNKFSVSSSGNAALAAARYIENNKNLLLEIFVGKNVPEEKKSALTALADEHIHVEETERPLQKLLDAVHLGSQSLRQSTDDTALSGYASLAEEIADITGVSDVFVATSSGTTAEALGTYFLNAHLPISLHIVQTSSCHPIAEAFDTRDILHEISIANAISDKVAHRRKAVTEIVKETKGSGYIVSNEEIAAAQALLPKDITANGALALAGLMRAKSLGRNFSGTVVCIVGGK